MAECSFHPGVETEVRCSECERPICPKDMVATPVGYKCPVCAKPKRSQYAYVKPRQYAGAVGAALLVGLGGGLLLGLFRVPFLFYLIALMWGSLVGEAVSRGSGGHRGPSLAAIAVGGVVLGSFAGGLGFIAAIAGGIGAAGALSWSWGR